MRKLESGVRWYTKATVTIAFPETEVGCRYCALLETYSRKQCRATGEYIADDRTIGYRCPLNFNIEENREAFDKYAKEYE